MAGVENIKIAPASHSGAITLAQKISQSGVSPPENKRLVRHEEAHAHQDDEGTGWYGVIVYNHPQYGEIILGAFYEFEGPRSPEARKRIASGPGFTAMSDQDWFIYLNAERELITILQRQPARESDPDFELDLEDEEDESISPRDPNISRIPEIAPQKDYHQLPLAA